MEHIVTLAIYTASLENINRQMVKVKQYKPTPGYFVQQGWGAKPGMAGKNGQHFVCQLAIDVLKKNLQGQSPNQGKCQLVLAFVSLGQPGLAWHSLAEPGIAWHSFAQHGQVLASTEGKTIVNTRMLRLNCLQHSLETIGKTWKTEKTTGIASQL